MPYESSDLVVYGKRVDPLACDEFQLEDVVGKLKRLLQILEEHEE